MTFTDGSYQERTNTVVDGSPATAQAVAAYPVAAPPVDPPAAVVVAADPHHAAEVRTQSASRFTPDALIASAVGLVLLVIGLIAVTRGGFDGSMDEPVVEVLGFTHTTLLGIVEIAFGLCLLASGASRSRSAAMFFGTVLGVAGFVGAVQPSSFETSLALESSMAWLAVLAGVIVALSALLMPRFASRTTTVART